MNGNKSASTALQIEQLRQLYAGLPMSLAVTSALGGLCVFILWPATNQQALLGWVILQAVLSAVRLVQWIRYRREPAPQAPEQQLQAFRVSTTLAGLVWGLLALFCYPSDLSHQVFLAFVIAGVTSGAITSLAADRRASITFLFSSAGPLAIQMLRTQQQLSITMGVMVALFLAFTALSARRAYTQFVDNIRLRDQADAARKQTACALTEVSSARTQLEAFITYAPAAVAIFDTGMRYLAYSRRWTLDYELGERELLGHCHYDIFPQVDGNWKAIHQRCLQGAIEHFEEEPFLRGDGSWQWLHLEVRPWRKHDGTIGGIIILSEDITARRAANEALRASNELLGKLSERVPGVIYQYRQRANGRREFLFVSERVGEILQLDARQLLSDAALLLHNVHPQDRAAVLAHFTVRPGQQSLRKCEYRVVLPVGGERWIHDESAAEVQPCGTVLIYGHISDITERKAADEERRRMNERMSLATECGGIGIWELDLHSNALSWDERMFTQYGLKPQQGFISRERWSQYLHSADLAPAQSHLRAAIAEKRDLDTEFRILRADGCERTLKVNARTHRDADGAAVRMIGVSWDITDLKRVERMKSEFVSVVSHELRTPLTSLRGAIGLLAGGVAGELSQQQNELVRVACRNSDRLAALIDDLLDLEKMAAGKMQLHLKRTDLRGAIQQSIEASAGLAAPRAVKLRLSETSVTDWVQVDAQRLQQVMANLLSNAIKFSDERASVDIAVHRKAAMLRVEVRDYGPGISAEFRPRLFEKFSQADSSDTRIRGGTGLGLAVCKSIMESFGGTIGCDSEPGHGAKFFFELPVA